MRCQVWSPLAVQVVVEVVSLTIQCSVHCSVCRGSQQSLSVNTSPAPSTHPSTPPTCSTVQSVAVPSHLLPSIPSPVTVYPNVFVGVVCANPCLVSVNKVIVCVSSVSKYIFVQWCVFALKYTVCCPFFVGKSHIPKDVPHAECSTLKPTLFLYLFKYTWDSRVFFILIEGLDNSANDSLIDCICVDSDTRSGVSFETCKELPVIDFLRFLIDFLRFP